MGERVVGVTSKWYIIDDVNPEPWAIGPLGVGKRHDGKWYPYVGPNQQLVTYQRAVKEQLEDFTPPMLSGAVGLRFFFWRRLPLVSTTSGRSHRSHVADATNLQKGLEDALQGIFFGNDVQVKDIKSVIVEQSGTTQSKIVINVYSIAAFDPSEIPDFVWNELDKVEELPKDSNIWSIGEGAF